MNPGKRAGTYKKLNVLISPTDACNLNCVYCSHVKHRKRSEKITIDNIKHFYQIMFPYYENVNIIWHGGEPLLMGLEFFTQAIELQNDYKDLSNITNSIQTNLTLMTDEYADFFKKNNIGISSSYDGSLNTKTRGSSEKIFEGLEKITNRDMKSGFIMTLSSENIHSLIESYELFKSKKISYRLNLYIGSTTDKFALNPDTAVKEIINLFNYYVNDESCNISIRLFNSLMEYFFNGKNNTCSNTSCLGNWIGLRDNGDIYSCNRYFPDNYCYGNIHDYDNISQAFESDGFRQLLIKAIERRNKCKICEIYDYCNGGCNNVHFSETGIENNGGTTCIILIAIFQYLEKWLKNLSSEEVKNPLIIKRLKKMKLF